MYVLFSNEFFSLQKKCKLVQFRCLLIAMKMEIPAFKRLLKLLKLTLFHAFAYLAFFALVAGCMGVAENCYGLIRGRHNWTGPPADCRREPVAEICKEPGYYRGVY